MSAAKFSRSAAKNCCGKLKRAWRKSLSTPPVNRPAANRLTLIEAPVQIRKRLVIYVQGYDPRGLAEYYRMFRREFRRTCELYGLTGKIGSAQNDPKRFI